MTIIEQLARELDRPVEHIENVVRLLDEGNTIKPECADVLHSLTDAARQIQVPGYGLVQMHPHSAFTITMNEDYAGTNFMNEATIDRFTPIHIAEPESIVDVLHRVVPEASGASLNICDCVYCAIRDRIRSAGGGVRGGDGASRPRRGIRWLRCLRARPPCRLRCGAARCRSP